MLPPEFRWTALMIVKRLCEACWIRCAAKARSPRGGYWIDTVVSARARRGSSLAERRILLLAFSAAKAKPARAPQRNAAASGASMSA
jgi:hypothetical protein